MKTKILIVDDDPVQLRLLDGVLTKFGCEVISANGGEEALSILEEHDVDVVVLDLVMPDLDGMAVLGRMRKAGSLVPVIVQTSQGGIDTVVSAMRAGAHDFVVKPFSPERLNVSIQNALKINTLETELQRAKRTVSGKLTFKDMITSSPRMHRVIDLGERAASSNIPILLEGESGVGKEMMARAIQGSSNRKTKPFVTVNCGAIPENLVESILFGHEKGAFTGAVEKQIGKFQEADGGTLFLDEVGELPLDVQVKLLRALQEGEVDPVGARAPVKVDIRVISATNRSLLDMVPELARHFTTRFAVEEGRRNIRGLTKHAIEMLMAYSWPGNIRQLENAVFRAVVLCDGAELTPAEFPQIATVVDGNTERAIPGPLPTMPQPLAMSDLHRLDDPNMIGGHEGQFSNVEDEQDAAMHLMDVTDNVRPLDELEAEIIETAVRHYGGQMSEVARRLGIGRSTLYRKINEYGINVDTNAA